MELVRTSKKGTRINPKKTLIFSNPKVGKTDICSYLTREGKWTLLDFEKNGNDYGSDFSEGVIQKMGKLSDVKDFCSAVKKVKEEEGELPFDGIIVDTLTALQDWCIPYAGKLYKASVGGKNWEEKPEKVLELANGAGYYWLRLAMTDVLNRIFEVAPHIILLGHKTDKDLEKKGVKLNYKEVDLLGKLKSIVPAQMDAVGYMFRKKNETIISFKTDELQLTGARCEHLVNQDIVIAESDENGKNLKTHWDKIFI